MRCGVVTFPGSNCDHDVYHVLKHVLDQEVSFLWHGETELRACELIVLPGGFAYGDYLRSGALAALSPIMAAVREHADRGGLVLGICNGFQVLCEAGLLPGALRRNRGLRFVCRDVRVRVERTDLPFTEGYAEAAVLRLPIAHAEGRFFAPDDTLSALEDAGQVVFRYVDAAGIEATEDTVDETASDEINVNGSAHGIAGLCNVGGNVLGMMPHPERCAEEVLGNTDGLALFAGAVGAAVGELGVAV